MIKRLWNRWLTHRQLKKLEESFAKDRTEFKDTIEKEGFTLVDNQVVCDSCRGNCGQCGSSIRMSSLDLKWQNMRNAHTFQRETIGG